jgi:signal-transduction protein with cAMP-binding, CBS, and nucleotidyltransferase domain
VGALVVLDGTKKLAGILSERDYARKVILQGRRSQDTPVSDIMTTKVICVNRERTIDECMALMTERRIRHLPVIEENEVIGIISIGDVVRAVIQEKQFLIEQLERYITSG